MSQEELRRVEVLARVKSEELRVVDAATLLRVSYRQAKRLWRRFRKDGAAGLKHGNAGQISHHAYEAKFRQKALQLVREKYSGAVGERFGPTLAAEHLEQEDGVKVHAETLRRWMLQEGLWSRERKGRQHRKRRERKKHFGELVQMDGSFHGWLEERGPEGCLINMVDDATNVSWAQLGEQETIWAVADALRGWIERYGVPLALYVDWKNLYKRPATVKEQLRGEEPITQFGRMCAKLGIAIIAASSPQAKGRVERSHGTHQDRLVKKLRRKEISSYAVTNIYLEREYLPEHNRRFARTAARAENYHRRAPRRDGGLDKIFRLETERTVSADWVVRYGNRFFQLQKQSQNTPPLSKVLVCEGRHGQLAIEYRGRTLRFQEIPAPVRPQGDASSISPHVPRTRKKSPWKPAASHPWNRAVREKMQKRAARPGAAPIIGSGLRCALSAPPAAPQGYASAQAND